MLRVAERALSETALSVLASIQAGVDEEGDYPARVARAKVEWDRKTGTASKQAAFTAVRQTLAKMCIGSVRCAYCEDSLADEVEHILPKNFYPEVAFAWENYLFACGPCNSPKGSRCGIVANHAVLEFRRRRNDPIVEPAAGQPALINPRVEDPLCYLEVDLGGVTPEGQEIRGTFEIIPAEGVSRADRARALFTIDVLGLNREAIRAARENAFGGFRARIREYVESKDSGAEAVVLSRLKNDLLSTPHLTIFADIRRQRELLPELNDLITRAPELLEWPLVPPPV